MQGLRERALESRKEAGPREVKVEEVKHHASSPIRPRAAHVGCRQWTMTLPLSVMGTCEPRRFLCPLADPVAKGWMKRRNVHFPSIIYRVSEKSIGARLKRKPGEFFG
jgi:hypothetical protein